MRSTPALMFLCWQVLCPQVCAQLNIDLDFSSFDTGANWGVLHNDDWGAGTPDWVKQQAAESTIRAAADYWEAAFVNSSTSLSHTVSIEWGSLSGSANGGTGWYPGSGELVDGLMIWDSDGSTEFFVDTTPWEHSEWTKFSQRSADLGAGSINVERVHYNAPFGPWIRDDADMFSVALHELGHALGLLGSYPDFAMLDVDGDGDLDLVDGSELLYAGGHHDLVMAPPESPGYPFDTVTLLGDYYPTAMGPTMATGVRKLLSSADILTLASVHGLDNPVLNPMLVPESPPVMLGLLGCLTILWRRSKGTRVAPGR